MMWKRAIIRVALAAALASPVAAQYYGKNKVQYDTFNWDVYHSPHFDIYFYPEEQMHLERVTSFAESAYLKVSSDLKHQIPFAIPLIFYKTHSEFEQTHLMDYVPEGVLAFAESTQNRMVLPIDLPADQLQDLITHELTHIFEYSILYHGLNSPLLQIKSPPTWVFEGLSDFEVGKWNLIDLMTVRDLVITDRLPTIENSGELKNEPANARSAYNIGHAIYDFIQSRWGMDGIRQFWWSMKKDIVGRQTVFMDALKIKPADFDQEWKKWMRDHFKDFRTREIPVDYGKDISPQGKLFSVFAMELSPSGDLVAILTGNRADYELDLVLLSTRDGKIMKNITKGYTTRYESIHAEYDPTQGDALAWSRDGDYIAFLARTAKRRSIFLVKVTSGKIVKRLPLVIDEASGPAFFPDGKALLLTGLKNGVADLFKVDIQTGETTNVTSNSRVEHAPAFSPDGKLIAFTTRVGTHDKIFVGSADDMHSAQQKTYGEWDDVTPSFSPDSKRIYYCSSTPEGIYNLFTLDLETGERTQWTDVLGGNFFPVRLPGDQERVLFTSYYRGNFGLFRVDLKKPIKVFPPEPAPQTQEAEEFTPAVTHELQPAGIHQRDTFKLLFAGRPPINIGVMSDGSVYGGTSISLSDMLGDKFFNFTVYSVRSFRTYVFTYANFKRRIQYQIQGFNQTDFYYLDPYYLDPGYPTSTRDAYATETIRGGSFTAYYPLDLYRRIEVGASFMRFSRDLSIDQYDPSQGRVQILSAWYAPFEIAFTHESTFYKNYGPIAGSVLRVGFQYSPGNGGKFIDRRTTFVDARKYLRISTDSLLAARAVGFISGGKDPGYFYIGGNNQLRGVDYLRELGDRGFYFNAELRFPFINALSSPIGNIGPLRGMLYFDLGYDRFVGDGKRFSTSEGGFHLVDGQSSFGGGLEFFLIAYPMHLDIVKRTDLKTVFKGTDVRFWIGFDF